MCRPCAGRLVLLAFFSLSFFPAWAASDPANQGGGYEDKLIAGGSLAPDPEDSYAEYDESGQPRGARIELVKTILDRNGERGYEDGVLFGVRYETENYGAFSIDGSLREGGNGTATVWQRNLAFDGGWQANNGVGVLNSANVDLVRRQYRFFVPTSSMTGASTELLRGQGTQVSASIGQPGLFTGIRVPAFFRLPGTVFAAGGQTQISPNVEAAIQTVGANGVSQGNLSFKTGLPVATSDEYSTVGAIASAAWANESARVQGNVIGSNTTQVGSHSGGWVDGWFKGEAVDHNAGVFRFQPGLTWGNQLIVSDLQGGYYRAGFQDQQWSWNGGLDYAAPVSGTYSGTIYATGSGRYQVSRRWAVGGGGNVRQGPNNAWSAFVFSDNRNDFGLTRNQINYATDETRQGTQWTIDQTWNVSNGMRLSTTALLLHESGVLGAFSNLGLAVNGGGDIGNNLSLDGNVQWNSQAGYRQGPAAYVNVAANWRFAEGFNLSLFAYQNNASVWRPLTIDSPIVNPGLEERYMWRDKGLFLSLRYDFSAGRSFAPLGGAPGGGSGRISGVIYLDENDDGKMNAGERGVANVLVLLDGRFSTRTDGTGHFEFPQVASGPRVISVIQDNLPLPWKVQNDGRKEIVVGVRDTVNVTIGASRMR